MKCACNSQLKSQALSSWHIHTAACYTTALALLHLCCTTASALQMQMLQHSISTAKFMQLMYHVKFIVASQFVLQYLCCSFHSAVFKPLFSFSCTSAATVIQHYLWSHIHAHNIHTATFTPQLCSSSHQQHLYHCLHAAAYMQHLHCTSHTVTFQLQHSHCCHHTPHFWCCIYACTCTH